MVVLAVAGNRTARGADPQDPALSARIASFEPNLRRYATALTRNHDAADDLVQATLLQGLRRQGHFRSGDLRAWLFTVMHNLHVNDIRRAVRRVPEVELKTEDAHPALAAPPVQEIPLIMRDLRRALEALSPEHRKVLLAVNDGRYDELADRFGIPIGTLRSRLSRARVELRRLWDDDEKPRAE